MANILYLVHRIPYPPDKGDKVRSFNILKHLLLSHRVFLGAFLDDSEDDVHVSTLEKMCVKTSIVRLDKTKSKIHALSALVTGKPLTVNYYHSDEMSKWVDAVYREENIDSTIVFSSAMAQFVPDSRYSTTLVDFVDVDSEKWRQYAEARRWPLSWLFERESRYLLNFEKSISEKAKHSFFVTDDEVDLFRKIAPNSSDRVTGLMNGVDDIYFSPIVSRCSPFFADQGALSGEIQVVFTGAMDYWPNIDAVQWFSEKVLPILLAQNKNIKFYIVGRNPTASVQALASSAVVVTGTVSDVRPYLQHASLVVAPLRVARGIQNKILEAMAMAKPVVASESCIKVIGAIEGVEIFSAESELIYAEKILKLIREPDLSARVGRAARNKVISDFSWKAHLEKIDRYIVNDEIEISK